MKNQISIIEKNPVGGHQVLSILYIKATVVSVCVGSAWKILPVTARSLWCALGGGGRESPVKHGAGGPARAGEGGGHGRGRTGRGGGASTGALCTGFTLVTNNNNNNHLGCEEKKCSTRILLTNGH
jgi:hypothetical protein